LVEWSRSLNSVSFLTSTKTHVSVSKIRSHSPGV
jgi:hypothetical protein